MFKNVSDKEIVNKDGRAISSAYLFYMRDDSYLYKATIKSLRCRHGSRYCEVNCNMSICHK